MILPLVADLTPSERDRSARLTDLADAAVVVLAEERGERRIFALDTGFQIYRFRGYSAPRQLPIL